MDATYRKLLTYAYNIVGSYDDAKDIVQGVMEKHIQADKSHIEHETNYLIRSVINSSINFKNRHAKHEGFGVWLPEPLSTESADFTLIKEQTISYSLLVLMERLNARERAVFILKEAFSYSHEEIADTLDTTVENSRQLLARAKKSLDTAGVKDKSASKEILDRYINAITNADMKALEELLRDDIRMMADGGTKIRVAQTSKGRTATSELLDFIYRSFLHDTTVQLTTINHQPAICFYKAGVVYNCHVFELGTDGKISHIFSIVDPDKLKSISLV